MALPQLYETPVGVSPSIIVYRNKPDQLFIQFQEEGMSVHNFTVDDELLHRNDMQRVHDFEQNADKLPSAEQRKAFQLVRNWLTGN